MKQTQTRDHRTRRALRTARDDAERLERWLDERSISGGTTPDDWAASGTCARLMGDSMRRYAFRLGGSLTHPEVRRDLAMVRYLADLLLLAGELEQRGMVGARVDQTATATMAPAGANDKQTA